MPCCTHRLGRRVWAVLASSACRSRQGRPGRTCWP
jgi:hypothetical protein